MNGTITRWVCWHPESGDAPDPRGTFTRRAEAEKRQKDRFWKGSVEYSGSDIQIKEVTFHWEAT